MKKNDKGCKGRQPRLLAQAPARRGWLALGLLTCSILPAASHAWADTTAAAPSRQGFEDEGGNWLLGQIRLFRSYPHLDRAYKLLAASKHAQAAAEMKTYLELMPSDRATRIAYMNVLYRLQRFDAVLDEAATILKADADNPSALLNRAMALQAKGNARAALDAYNALLASRAVDRQTRLFAAGTAADLALQANHYDEALAALDAIGSERADYGYYTRRAAALVGLKRLDEAQQAYGDALRLARGSAERKTALEALVYLERRHGQLDLALGHVDELLKLSPQSQAWLREKAVMHYLQKDAQAALAAMSELPVESLVANDHFFIGNVRLEQHAYAQAASEYEAILRAPGGKELRYKAYMGLGYAYAGANDMRHAQAAFASAIEIEPAREADQALQNVTRMLRAVNYHPTATPSGRSKEAAAERAMEQGAWSADARRRPEPRIAGRRAPDAAAPAGAQQPAQAARNEAAQHAYDALAAGDDALAVAAFERAIAAGAGSEQVYLDAGFAHMRLKQWQAARDDFLQALQLSRSLKNIVYVARSHVAAEQPELALQYFLIARQQLGQLPPEEQKAILLEIGHLHARRQDFAAAALVWNEAYALAPDADILLNIAYAQESSDQADLALQTLARLDDGALAPAAQLKLYQQRARLHEKENQAGAARDDLMRAAQLEPTAIRHYQLGMFELKYGQEQASIEHIGKAFELDPGNLTYAEQLAYLHKKRGDYARAEKMFEYVIERNPARTALLQDLAYTYKQHGNNDAAIAWFKRSIDAKYAERREARLAQPQQQAAQRAQPAAGAGFDADEAARMARAAAREAVATEDAGDQAAGSIANDVAATADAAPAQQDAAAGHFRYVSFHDDADAGRSDAATRLAQAEAASTAAMPDATPDRESVKQGQDEEIYRMRQEVRELSRRFQLNVYQSYRAKSQSQSSVASTPPGFFNSGAIPSQGGMELIYQPPGIGYQDGKIFQLFARTLWSNQPDSLRIAHDTVQAAAGARYKPFKEQDLFVSLERLFKVGDQSQSDWLARLSYSWTRGYDLKLDQSSWNQTLFYADLGYFFPNAGISALYSELRQGRSFNIDNRYTVTPHVLVAGRAQRPDPQDLSYLEAGAGVSLKIRFNENRYVAERSSMEFLAQYRKGLNHQHAGSWVFTAALSF